MSDESIINLDDFEVNFEGALGALADKTIARVEQDTKGMTDMQRNEYFLSRACAHLAECHRLDAPAFLIERAKENIARLEAKRDALQKP